MWLVPFVDAMSKKAMCVYDSQVHMVKADVQIDLNKLLGYN